MSKKDEIKLLEDELWQAEGLRDDYDRKAIRLQEELDALHAEEGA